MPVLPHIGNKITHPSEEGVMHEIHTKGVFRYDIPLSPRTLRAEFLGIVGKPEDKMKLLLCYMAGDKRVSFTSSAMSQLLNKIHVPSMFYDRCPSWLKAENFNYFNDQHQNNYLLRMDPQEDPADVVGSEDVRAVLSDAYGIIDDEFLFPEIFKALEDRKDIGLRLFQHDDRLTQLVINFSDATGIHYHQEYTAGLVITNSETGHSSVWIEPVVHIPSATFVSRHLLKKQGLDCRIIHRGKFPAERVASMVAQAKEIAQVGIVQLAEAFETSVSSSHAISFVKSIDALPNRFAAILEEEWANEERIIKAEAARRVILLAQELPLFNRIQVEQCAGTFIGLFDNYKERMAAVLQEIENE